MSVDVATLGIKIDANGAVTTVKQLGGELDRLAVAGDKVSRTTKEQEQELRKLAEISRSLGDIQGKQFQTLIRLNGGQEKFLQIQRQIDEELRIADQIAKQYETTLDKTVATKDKATQGANRLRSGFATLTSQVIGTNPVVGQLASTLAGFAVGGTVTVGVLAGLSALGLGYNKLTEHTRKAREEQDRFVESLARARDEELRASPEGRAASVEDADEALRQRRRELANLQLAGAAGTADIAGGADFGADPKARLKAIEDATKAVRQAEINLSRAKVDEAKQRIAAENAVRQALEGGDAILKGIDERRKKEQNEELARLKAKLDLLLKINGLPDLSALTANIDARIQSNPIPDYLAGKTGGQVGVSKEEAKRQEEESRANIEWEKANAQRILAEGKAEKSISGLDRAAQTASQALEYYLVSKIGGGGLGASLGASIGKGAFQDISSKFSDSAFSNSATGQAIFNPLAAGIGAFVGGLLDSGRAAKEHAKAFAELTRSYKEARADFDARANGTAGSVDDQIRKVQQEADRQRLTAREIYDSPAGRNFFPGKYEAELKKIAEAEEKYIALLKKESEIKAKQYDEDLQVRYLRAQGKDKEADALDLKNRQDRERQALIDSFGDEIDANEKARLAFLDVVLAAEKSSAALDEMSRSALNLVSGYRYQNTIFNNAPINPFGPEIQGGWEGTPPVTPQSVPQGATSINVEISDVKLVLPDGTVLSDLVLKNFQKKSQRKFGTTTRWSEIQ